MNQTIKRIILSVLFIAILCLGLTGLYKIFSWKDTSGDYFSCLEELKTLPDNTVDVVAVGPSRIYDSVNPAILWNNYGITSFDLAISGMAQNSAYYHLKELLKTQSPKIVFMEASLLYTDSYAIQGNLYRNTIVMDSSKNNYDLITTTVSDEDKWTYLLKWPVVHSRYKELKKGDFVTSNINRFNLGYEATFEVNPQDIDESVFTDEEAIEISETTQTWIDKLVTLSKENGFELIFIHVPQNMDIYYHKIYVGACEYLDTYGIEHIDMSLLNDEIMIDYSTDFVDANHVNVWGAEKVSNWLSDYINDNYSLQDYRGMEGYERWDQCSLFYAHKLADHVVVNTGGYQGYVDNVINSDNMLAIIADRYGVEVYMNGDSIYNFAPSTPVFDYKVNTSDFLHLACVEGEDGVATTLYIGANRIIAPEDDCLTVVTYDLITDVLVDVKRY